MPRQDKRNIVMSIDSAIYQKADGSGSRAVINIYDDISNDGYDMWSGEVIHSETSEKFIRDKLEQFRGVQALDVHISSNGGSVKVGFNLYSQIKSFECPKKTAYIDGVAASIASVIAMACDEVVMPVVGLMVIHNAWMLTCGNSSELRKDAEDLDVISAASKEAYLAHSKGKISEETLTTLMDAESYLSARECLAYGLCDRIYDDTGMGAEEKLSGVPVQSLGFPEALARDRPYHAIMSRLNELSARVASLEKGDAPVTEDVLQSDGKTENEPYLDASFTADVISKFINKI